MTHHARTCLLSGFAAFAILALPGLAAAQCEREALTAITSGSNPKFKFWGIAAVTWANIDPVSDGLTVDLNGSIVTFPAGTYGGGGTAGWIAAGPDRWSYKDADGIPPKLFARLDNDSGQATFKLQGVKVSIDGLTGSIGADSTPSVNFSASGEGCATNFVNDSDDFIQDCRYKDGQDPAKIKCKSLD